MSVVLAVGDLHAPFAHRDHLAFLTEVKKKYRPTDIVCLGDEADMCALSDYDHDPDGHSAGAELEAAIEQLQGVYKLFPRCLVATSNHTSRIFRRALKVGIPKSYLKTYREFLRAPDGWWWDDSHTIDGVEFVHGTGYSGSGGALKCALAKMSSVVLGHIHAHAGIAWARNSKFLIFGFNVGWLGDQDAYAMQYAKNTDSKGVLGCGIIRDGIPTFIPMVLKPGGRWGGDL